MVRRLVAPPIVDPRKDRLALRCEYDLHGNELYSVNWYRNEDVLFRYSPSLEPKATVYSSVVDVNVSLEHSNAEQLLLLGDRDVRKSRYLVLHNLTYLLVKWRRRIFRILSKRSYVHAQTPVRTKVRICARCPRRSPSSPTTDWPTSARRSCPGAIRPSTASATTTAWANGSRSPARRRPVCLLPSSTSTSTGARFVPHLPGNLCHFTFHSFW